MIFVPEIYQKQAFKARGNTPLERIESLANIWLKCSNDGFSASEDIHRPTNENRKRFLFAELFAQAAFDIFFARHDLAYLNHLAYNHYPVLFDIAQKLNEPTMMDFAGYATIELQNALK